MPWWGVVSSVLAPVLLIGGWTVAADLQPAPFDPISRTISTLAADGSPHRWLITVALFGVGLADVLTGLALRSAARPGQVLLIAGGICGMLVAANPQPQQGNSPVHVLFAVIGVILLTIWPVTCIKREPQAPLAFRPTVACASAGLTLCLLLWFTAELPSGSQLGLAERILAADQALWPLAVVLTVLTLKRQAAGQVSGAD